MHPPLALLLIPLLAHATPFNKEFAESYYETGVKPSAEELGSGRWLQVGGLPLYNPERATWPILMLGAWARCLEQPFRHTSHK